MHILHTTFQKKDDPLKPRIQKLHDDANREDSVVQKIKINSYDIVLCNQRMIKNFANFCCNNLSSFKSPLCWDFTFELRKSPSFFVLVITYRLEDEIPLNYMHILSF